MCQTKQQFDHRTPLVLTNKVVPVCQIFSTYQIHPLTALTARLPQSLQVFDIQTAVSSFHWYNKSVTGSSLGLCYMFQTWPKVCVTQHSQTPTSNSFPCWVCQTFWPCCGFNDQCDVGKPLESDTFFYSRKSTESTHVVSAELHEYWTSHLRLGIKCNFTL